MEPCGHWVPTASGLHTVLWKCTHAGFTLLRRCMLGGKNDGLCTKFTMP